MELLLKRFSFTENGIFGQLFDEQSNIVAYTLEHAYQADEGSSTWTPKIPAGQYTCQRGQHQLGGMVAPFETFQVMDVPGHTNILLHCGNLEKDSSGCILLGSGILGSALTESRKAFASFMAIEDGLESFVIKIA
jgi:hypothetical protein